MAGGVPLTPPALLDLPLEVLTDVCQQLDFQGLVRIAATCTRLRHGDGGLETLELPTTSPVVTALLKLQFSDAEMSLFRSTRPIGCPQSWVAYLARCVRQRRCREAPPIAAGDDHSLHVDAAGRLLACGKGVAVGHGDENPVFTPTPVAFFTGIRVRSIAAGNAHNLALGWDGRVYSWGNNQDGQLGQGDNLDRPSPALVEGLEDVCGVSAAFNHSLAVTHSGAVFRWGRALQHDAEGSLRRILVEGFGGVRVRRALAGYGLVFAIGEEGELFSWGLGWDVFLGHGDTQDQPSPKRVEALRGVPVRSVAAGVGHVLALTEDGQVYVWGSNTSRATLGNPNVESELLPKLVEALRGVRVSSIAAADLRSYAMSDTGEVWAWGCDGNGVTPLGHYEPIHRLLPEPVASLRGVKVDAVAAGNEHTLAVADDGSVYAWGNGAAAKAGALGLGPTVSDARTTGRMPQRIPGLRVVCAS
jgi:alpha-tubulin suppressor-like RCC1 family protein